MTLDEIHEANGRPNDGLGQPNPSTPDEVVRRGQEAMKRKLRSYDDWLLIGEAVDVGRTEVMRELHTNKPFGKRYATAMAQWLFARTFHLINPCTRKHLLECLQHRAEINKWRATLTEADRFAFDHPTTVLRKWKAKAVVPDPNAPPKPPSAIAKLKETNIELQEKVYRLEREIARGGGDLWTPADSADAIAKVMLGNLSPNKAERVARAILTNLKDSGRLVRSERPVKRINAGI